jgi:23S rRNA (uridine2552-2'-O)-methyltransferase
MHFSKDVLKNDGKFISKIFVGSTFNEIIAESKKIFKKSKIFKPSASRKESKESFIICSMLR